MIKTTELTMELACKLDAEELRERGDLAADLSSEIDRCDRELTSVKAHYKSEITSRQADLSQALREIKARECRRDVKCQVIPDFDTNSVRTVRADTFEVIRERAMTYDERQGELVSIDGERQGELVSIDGEPEETGDLDGADAGDAADDSIAEQHSDTESDETFTAGDDEEETGDASAAS